MMNTVERREKLLAMLKRSEEPLSASTIAALLHVSRQVIVSDVAILRASGSKVSSTARGYIYCEDVGKPQLYGYVGMLACKHTNAQLGDELYTVVDNGGYLIDVVIEHKIYGQLSGILDIGSRYDADKFLTKIAEGKGKPLSNLTEGIHLHRIGCKDVDTFLRIEAVLREKGLLLE